MKQNVISSNKHSICELPDKFPKDGPFKIKKYQENLKISSKFHIGWYLIFLPK